jgi:hypothetical protein
VSLSRRKRQAEGTQDNERGFGGKTRQAEGCSQRSIGLLRVCMQERIQQTDGWMTVYRKGKRKDDGTGELRERGTGGLERLEGG